MAGFFLQKLNYLKETKHDIAEAIEDCDVTVPEDASFFSFGNLIRQIQGQFNKNKRTGARTYSSSNNGTGSLASSTDSTATSGYPSASTGTEPKPQALFVDKLPEDGSAYYMTPELWKAIPANSGKECDGFSSVSIDLDGVPTGQEKLNVRFWASTAAAAQAEATPLFTDVVPKLGTAHYQGQLPSENGKRFVGWNPNPVNVTEDMDCFPRFSSEAQTVTKSEIPDSEATWEDIAANGGKPYAIGRWKNLTINAIESDLIPRYAFYRESEGGAIQTKEIGLSMSSVTLKMVKVYEGEDGTDSTWVSDGSSSFGVSLAPGTVMPMEVNSSPVISSNRVGLSHGPITLILPSGGMSIAQLDSATRKKVEDGFYYYATWRDEFLRKALNSVIFDAISSDALKRAIRPVLKSRVGSIPLVTEDKRYMADACKGSYVNAKTIDVLWQPSDELINISNTSQNNVNYMYNTYDPDSPHYIPNANKNPFTTMPNAGQCIGFCISATGGSSNAGNNGESNNSEETETPEGNEN